MLITPARTTWLVLLIATLFAIAGARPYAGGWNDGSRLAAVESLVERGTLVIDDSPYCDPDAGTKDKLFIGGHYYSDKPAVISALMAGLYRVGMWLGLPRPSQRPDVFCLTLTLLTASGSYLVALLCLYRLGHVVGLRDWTLTVWLASFALATFALAYTRHVNNHIIHLAILSGVCLLAVQVAVAGPSLWRSFVMGAIAGLGFNLDLGSGPLLVITVVALVAWRTRRIDCVVVCALAATPWVVAGMAINYAIGGVLLPVNMIAENLRWPGSPFDESNLTGLLRHSPRGLIVYSLALLFGKHGIMTHNLGLFLALPGLLVLRKREWRPELVALLGWCAASWAMYSALSNNYGGGCCSVRWFVPFLAPMYLLLAVHLRESPGRVLDLLILSAWGAVLAMIMWIGGPWTLRMVPLLWPIVGMALASWLVLACYRAARYGGASRSPLPVSRAA